MVEDKKERKKTIDLDSLMKTLDELKDLASRAETVRASAVTTSERYHSNLVQYSHLVDSLERDLREYAKTAGDLTEIRREMERKVQELPEDARRHITGLPNQNNYDLAPLKSYKDAGTSDHIDPRPLAVAEEGKEDEKPELPLTATFVADLFKAKPNTSKRVRRELERQYKVDDYPFRGFLIAACKKGLIRKIDPVDQDYEDIAKAIGAQELAETGETIYFNPSLYQQFEVVEDDIPEGKPEEPKEFKFKRPVPIFLQFPTGNGFTTREQEEIMERNNLDAKRRGKQDNAEILLYNSGIMVKTEYITDMTRMMDGLASDIDKLTPMFDEAYKIMTKDEVFREDFVRGLAKTERNEMHPEELTERFGVQESTAHMLLGVLSQQLKELGRNPVIERVEEKDDLGVKIKYVLKW